MWTYICYQLVFQSIESFFQINETCSSVLIFITIISKVFRKFDESVNAT